ncbi:MAG: hypothetical protein C0606_11850 [Hyphomicrobiales bacterium]|nr:MAG: hypothetical protein C0606_11850 [Hyphomicrobiales bacterium]
MKLFAAVMIFLASSVAALAGPLPFTDGRYVTDRSLCGQSEEALVGKYGDMIGMKMRNINGEKLNNAYEMYCTVSNVARQGDSVTFRAECNQEGEVNVINGSYRFISEDSFALGSRVFTRCGG